MEQSKSAKLAYSVLAGVLLVVAGFVALETYFTADTAQKTVLGPAVFPYIIATALGCNAVALAWSAHKERFHDIEMTWDIRPPLFILAGIAFVALCLEPLGWIVTSGISFVAGAYAFGERRIWRGLVSGLIVGAATYYLFDTLLGLSLPVGDFMETLLP